MKKLFTFIFVFLFSAVTVFAQTYSIPKVQLGLQKNENVPSILDGQVIYAQENSKKAVKSSYDIPEELSNGVVIIKYNTEYYYLGQKRTATYQMVYSNVKPDKKFTKATDKKPIDVNEGDILGVATDNVTVVIRCLDIDEHLSLISKSLPLQSGAYWYFGLESFMPNVMKYLLFQPLESRKTEIQIEKEKTQSLESIISSGDPKTVVSYPAMPVKIKTTMKSLPGERHKAETFAEQMIFQQDLPDMTLEATALFDGVTMHFIFPENFDAYFKNEYKIGDDIWLYGYILYSYKGEIFLYGRDFSLNDPDENVNKIQNNIIMLNRQIRNQNNQKLKAQGVDLEAGDYVDMTQKIPSGGYATYERFFVVDEDTGIARENFSNIEVHYYDKKGLLVARMLYYDDSKMVRNTTTYKYDKKDRVIEVCRYDSKMYQDNGWKVDPKQSRIFNKDVTVYKDTKNGTEAVTTKYRYSYFPRVEHPDGMTIKKFNSKGVLTRIENISEESPDSIDITEYDDFGNITYVKYTVEKPTETSYEYVYDGDKIIQGTANDLMKGEVTKWTCEYDENGRLIKEVYPKYLYEYRYNKDGKLIESKSTNTETGVVWQKDTYRYDKKTGIMLLHIEESKYPSWSMTRFWYTELKKDGWEKEIDPWKLLEELPE